MDFAEHFGGEYRILAPDLRGHGLSGQPEAAYTAEEMAEDMVQLLNHLQIGSVLLVGHSMGGHIAGCLTAA